MENSFSAMIFSKAIRVEQRTIFFKVGRSWGLIESVVTEATPTVRNRRLNVLSRLESCGITLFESINALAFSP
ncbi:hypothetical protein EVAR_10653_1 [Eumeta japonica]|uniref:Uncharacterized protein n=1 Tax=Eumeta variegata TaxID=151549 RepID=A0A4C1U890_EUMVA|nr:hypothetical protein EVAR_10653_1 [Eumeta japonica]